MRRILINGGLRQFRRLELQVMDRQTFVAIAKKEVAEFVPKEDGRRRWNRILESDTELK